MSLVTLDKCKCSGCGELVTCRADRTMGIPIYCLECRKLSGKPESDWMSPYAAELGKNK